MATSRPVPGDSTAPEQGLQPPTARLFTLPLNPKGCRTQLALAGFPPTTPHSTAARPSPVTYPTGSTECLLLCASEWAASAWRARGPFGKTGGVWPGPMWARFLPHRFLLSLRALDLVWPRLAPASPTPRAEQAGARQVQLLALTLKERFQSRAAFPSFGGSRRTSLGTGPPPVFRVAHVCSSDPGWSFSFLTPQCFSTGAVSLRAELLFTTWGCHACGQLSQLLATTCQSRPGSVTPPPPGPWSLHPHP